MFRFTIRDVLWLTAVVAMGVVVWNNQIKTKAERAAFEKVRRELEKVKRELESRVQSMEREWDYLQARARQKEFREYEVRRERLRFRSDRVPEEEIQRATARSVELGAPQPKSLPPGYGEQPNQD